MSMSVRLYQHESEDIKVTIDARFDGESLVIDGYDIGKTVKEYWGDSDYEYSTTVPPLGVRQLYAIFRIPENDKKGLLKVLSERYNTNFAYSEIGKMLDENKIKYEGFSWV